MQTARVAVKTYYLLSTPWKLKIELFVLWVRLDNTFMNSQMRMCIYTFKPLQKILPCVAFAFSIFGRGIL